MPDEMAMMPMSAPKATNILARIFMLAMKAKALDERVCNPPVCDVMICVSALEGFEEEATWSAMECLLCGDGSVPTLEASN